MTEPTLAEIALHAKDLIADGWVQGALDQLDEHGLRLVCPERAIELVAGQYPGCEWAGRQMFKTIIGQFDIADWNDAPERTKQDVLDAFDEMARLAKERGL